MRIEILYFEDCPNVETARENVRQALELEGACAQIVHIEITAHDEARRLRFLGSPSIRVDGIDVEPGAAQNTDYGLMCRSYVTKLDSTGFPSVEMIRSAMKSAK